MYVYVDKFMKLGISSDMLRFVLNLRTHTYL